MSASHLTTIVNSDIIVLFSYGKLLALAFIFVTLAMAAAIITWFMIAKLRWFGQRKVKTKHKKKRIKHHE